MLIWLGTKMIYLRLYKICLYRTLVKTYLLLFANENNEICWRKKLFELNTHANGENILL